MSPCKVLTYDFDIDKYLNPLIPPNLTSRLPRPLAHFLGHRKSAQKDIGNLLVAFWACLGAFLGVVVIEWVFMIPAIKERGPPLAIASFGAAAILEYNTIESPLAQPRNTILGHVLATATGVSVTKLFLLSPHFEDLRWLAGGLAVGLASAVMTLTKTIYPPAGATALLAAVDPMVEQLGWYLIPLVLAGTATTLCTSLIANNIMRRYPTYWWTPAETGWSRRGVGKIEKVLMAKETGVSSTTSSSEEGVGLDDGDEKNAMGVGQTLGKEMDGGRFSMIVTEDRIVVPEGMLLTFEEKAVLEILRNRLKQGVGDNVQSGDNV